MAGPKSNAAAARKTAAAPTANKSSSLRHFLLGAAAILLLVFAAYAPALRGEYLWDDDVLLTQNPLIPAADGLKRIWFSTEPHDYFPLTLTTLWIEWRLWGMNSTGYHVINVLLHALGSLLLWRVLRALNIPGAWLAAAIFALHPVCAASAAWISERKNTLSLVFYLLAFLFYLRSAPSKNTQSPTRSSLRLNWYIFSLVAFLLALLSKTSTVMLPVVLLGLAWWRFGKITKSDLLKTAPFFALSLVFGLITVWFQTHRAIGYESDPRLTRLLGGGWALWFYLFKTLVPLNLSMVYPRWNIDPRSLAAWLPGLLWIAGLVACWPFRKTWGKHVLLALGYFTVTLLPVLGFFDMSFFAYSRAADHLNYLPLIGVIALVVGGAATFLKRVSPAAGKPAPQAVAAGAAVLALLFYFTTTRAKVFSGPEPLWRDTLQKNPRAWVAYNNLGNAIAGKQNFGAAITEFETAVRLNPNYADAHNNLGNALCDLGRIEESLPHYRKALQLRNQFTFAHNNLGYALLRLERVDEAIAEFQAALRINPAYTYAHNNLGLGLMSQRKFAEAAESFRAALRLDPNYFRARVNLANCLSESGQLDAAIAEYQSLLKLQPGNADVLNQLGVAHAMKTNFTEAARWFGEAARIEPDKAHAIGNLANVLAQQGRHAEAVEKYTAALKLEPGDAGTRANLANLLLQTGRFAEAADEFSAILQAQPGNAQAHFGRGLALANLKKNPEAATHFREALRLRPGFAEAQRQLDLLGTFGQN